MNSRLPVSHGHSVVYAVEEAVHVVAQDLAVAVDASPGSGFAKRSTSRDSDDEAAMIWSRRVSRAGMVCAEGRGSGSAAAWWPGGISPARCVSAPRAARPRLLPVPPGAIVAGGLVLGPSASAAIFLRHPVADQQNAHLGPDAPQGWTTALPPGPWPAGDFPGSAPASGRHPDRTHVGKRRRATNMKVRHGITSRCHLLLC